MARGNLLFTGRRYEPYMALTLVAAEGNPISSPHALRPAEESFNTPADDDADQETASDMAGAIYRHPKALFSHSSSFPLKKSSSTEMRSLVTASTLDHHHQSGRPDVLVWSASVPL
jgi:hypothetical protein